VKTLGGRSRPWIFGALILGLTAVQFLFLRSVHRKGNSNSISQTFLFSSAFLRSFNSSIMTNSSEDSTPPIKPFLNRTYNSSVPMRDHPHAGAIDEDGNYGYVHDPTVLVHSKLPFEIPLDELGQVCAPPGAGPEGIGGYRLLTEKIKVANNDNKRLKIFCAVYTHPVNEDIRLAIGETWGGHCDGYIAATLKTDEKMGTVHIPHMGEENYNGIWQKVRSMWSYIHDNFLESYDFFNICGDDTFVIVENLRAFLESKRVEHDAGGPGYPKPLYIGMPIMSGNNQTYFNGGGSGYTLNRAALKMLVQEGFPVCRPFVNASAEDRFVGDCFRSFGVRGYDARDDAGEQRYLNEPNFVYYFHPNNTDAMSRWWAGNTRGMPPKYGLEAASHESVSFHHIRTPAKVRRIYKILYRQKMADCSADGSDEPGGVMPEEYYDSLPHNNCSWYFAGGKYHSCPFHLYKEYELNFEALFPE